MALLKFKYYLHDHYNRYETTGEILRRAGATHLDVNDYVDHIGRAFYEVELDCVLDTDTKEVYIVGVGGNMDSVLAKWQAMISPASESEPTEG